ncbi:unnamed protein product [Closterium sp. NIES-64]|nr:unnamed protein product [Closterium sp. NIES-64]
MYAVTGSDEDDCYRCFPPDPGIGTAASGASEAAALGASASVLSGTGESALSGTVSASASHTFTLDSGASRSFFRDRTTLTPLSRPVAVSLADPSGGPVLSRFSTVLPCPAAPSGTLSGLYLPSFSTNLVSGADLQDVGVHQFTPARQRVTHCTEASTGRHLATFTRRPGSSLYTLTTASPPGAESGRVPPSGQVFAAASRSGPESAPCSCRRLSHETLLWHHRLGHPSLLRLRGMASRLLVSGFPRSLPPLPQGPGPACVPCVEGRQRAAPHSSQFPPTEAPLQTLHMDVWGPARVRGQGQERYFLLAVDDYSRYTTVFPLRSKGEVTEVLIDWIRAARLQLRQSFGYDFPVLRLHSDRGGEFSSGLCVPTVVREASASPSRFRTPRSKMGLLSAALAWYAAHQINLHPRVSRPETSPALLWTGKVGDASAFRDVTFDESVPYYRLFPYRTPSLPPPPLFLTRSSLSRSLVTLVLLRELSLGVRSLGVRSLGVLSLGVLSLEVPSQGVLSLGVLRLVVLSLGVLSLGVLSLGVLSLGVLCLGVLRLARSHSPHRSCVSGLPGAGGVLLVLVVLRLQRVLLPARPGGARTVGAGAAGSEGSPGAGAAEGVGAVPAAGGPTDSAPGAAAGGSGAAGGATVVGAPAGGTGAVPAVSGVAARPRPYFVPLLQQVLGLTPPPPLEGPQPVRSQPQLQPASPLPARSPYAGPTGGLTERREPASRPASPVRTECASGRGSRQRPPPVPSTHRMSLRPSTAPLRAPLPSPPASSLLALADPESDSLRAASPTVTRLLATAVTDPSFESSAASALVTELVDFAARCRLDYAASLVAESESACPPSIGGECALGTDVLEDRQEEFQCLAAASPHLASVLLAPEGDPDAPDIPTPRSYAEAIEGPYSSQWQAAMDAEMASWKSTGTYADAVPPPGANIVSGMWIFRVKRPPGSPSVFKARYVARGFSQRQGVDYFQTFSPTPKMTTLRVLLHVAAHRGYELHSLDFSTAFLQGSLHEEIWLRRPPGFTGSFPPGTQWSLRRPVYGLRQAPREWHDTLRTTLTALGFAPSTADPSLFLRTDTSLPPFYILVYVDDLVFATADTAGLAYVKSELQKRHTCTDLGELRSYLGLQITRDRARRTITLTQSHMVQQVLQRFGFTYSSPQATPLPTRHSLSALPSDESVESSGYERE